MRRKINRFLSILCIMTVITSLITVMPVRAEEVQEAETENIEVVSKENMESETEETETIQPEESKSVEALEVDELVTESVSESEMETIVVSEENITLASTDQIYTDEQGNIFTYVLDESGSVTITGITASGAALTIPATINDVPVVAVANGNNCVVSNPSVKISELTINCNTIGVRAFNGLSIGTLTIGADVKELYVSNDINYDFQFYYQQFAETTIDKVVFNAVELIVGHYTGDYADEFYGPFYEASIRELEIGSNVTLIPEKMFANAIMELDTLEIQAERIGAYAFSGETITIHHLTIGENVKVFEEYSNSTTLFHHWEQFSEANIGTFTYLSDVMDIGHTQPVGGSDDLYAPFMSSVIGSLEIGDNVTRIPELFLLDAKITIEKLNLT